MANREDRKSNDGSVMRDVLLPCMHDMDMVPLAYTDAEAALVPRREGACFRLPADVASGYFWVYAEGDFAVSVTEMTFREDYRETCRHPRFVAARYYASGWIEESFSERSHQGPFLEGHVTRNALWDALIHASEPVHNVEVMLTPQFYEQFLREVYSGEQLDAEAAFASIDGVQEFPELIVLLRQLEAYRGRGASARLFYRSKVTEAVALVVEKSRALARQQRSDDSKARTSNTSDADARAIARVAEYLHAHAYERVDAAELARLSCMSQSKLRTEFKRMLGCTVTAYVQRRRMVEAARLLAEADMTLGQVAAAVGYRSANRFKELFEREYGCSPAVYRRSFDARG